MNFRNISLLFTSNYVSPCFILLSLLLLTLTFSIKFTTEREAYGATCVNLPISGVIANGAQSTNPASEAIDNDATTRWSNQGLGSWIRLDLGTAKTICSVDISWFRGNERVNTFEIAVSNDGTNFTPIYSSKSGGQTSAAEKYDFEDIMRRYVKITFKGNTQNDWASINEIDVFGMASTDTTKPTVTGTIPGGGTSNIQLNSVIKVTFSEPMLASSVSTNTFTLRIADTPTKLGGAVSLSLDRKTATFDPSANLATSTRYVATIFTEAKDLAGNALSQSKKWSFTTAAGGTTNHNPVANSQSVTTNKNTAKSITLTASDSDADKLTYSIVKQPSHGTLTGTLPSLTFTPALGYTGTDSFTFKVSDGKADSNIATVSITISTPASAGTDKFGIKKIYGTKPGGEEWYMNMEDPEGDTRFNPQNSISQNSDPDGSWKMKSSKVRMGVYTSSGYSSSKIPTLDHSKIASKGYMLAPNDWKNIEMTMYTKVNNAGSDDNFAPYSRGGRHTGGGSPEGCEGSAYKGDLFFSGKVRFAKEQWHVSYVFTDYKSGTTSIKGKWVGFKFMLYNFQEEGGKTSVKMELWLDKNDDGTFVRVDEKVDRGGWGNAGRECNGAPDQIITWGGPIATFRWDTATDVDFKHLSVREIQPPQ